ncbi:MAG: anthranilate synthase component I family protein [Methanomicrobiales archaeon]|nr:anthranilate synthase component I family protein [Methanomicrobiales archaeon]MDD1655017.1 anthranilate synthase component I family protein [Methanomicrobiales archaeon]
MRLPTACEGTGRPTGEGPAVTGTRSLNLGEEEFLALAEHQARPLFVPLCTRIPLPYVNPTDVYASLCHGPGILLESMEGSEKIARYSYLGWNPGLTVSLGDQVAIAGSEPLTAIARSPEGETAVDQLRSLLQRFAHVKLRAPRFSGGMVGYFSYDLVHSLFPMVPRPGETAGGGPCGQFMLVTDCIVFDHRARELFVFASPLLTYESDPRREYRRSAARIQETVERLGSLPGGEAPDGRTPAGKPPLPSSDMSREEYCRAVERVKEHIIAGDIFQAVISRSLECDLPADPFQVYRALRQINPSPYLYYLDFGDRQLIGASPEMLVRVERGRVTTVPIAGTRPRGRTPEEDARLAQELREDEKERAEHTMLVDLARNDVGRVSRYGSVRVEDFMAVERFSHVQHLVSTVHGTLEEHRSGYDALKACFPAGTVSGAPKIRAMQIIGEMEKTPRGPYAGAVGFAGFDRTLEFAITIRTILVQGGRASFRVGAGIVADSVPENEWIETENKGMAMMRAIEAAGGYR